ncbi:MAG: hypothetical protein ACREMB_19720 [Candidatus Rokuibacteriota bacterium]
MERILFGDNQFFGVNHMSEEKARAQAMRFRDTAAIMRVLDHAYDLGINVFMCTTHDRLGEIADLVRRSPGRYPELQFYPCMPYAHKYANSVSEVGIVDTVRRFVPGGVVETLIKGAISAATRDASRLMQILVDAEMKPLAGVRTPIVFLQNVVTDLLLGLKMYDMLAAFAQHIHERYDAEAGFITMNLPMLVNALERVGIEDPIVCANVNKIGFRMCGGVEAYRELLRARRCRAIAMSVFASGAIPAEEAIEWVCDLEGVQSIVFGASSPDHIRHTRALIARAWGLAPAPAAAVAAAA